MARTTILKRTSSSAPSSGKGSKEGKKGKAGSGIPATGSRREKKSHGSKIVNDLRAGKSLSLEFFTYNAWILVIVLVAVLSLIGLRYKTKTKMAEIKALTHQLELAESGKLREKADYMSLVRETEMRRLVHEKGLGLIFQEQPPFEVEGVKD